MLGCMTDFKCIAIAIDKTTARVLQNHVTAGLTKPIINFELIFNLSNVITLFLNIIF